MEEKKNALIFAQKNQVDRNVKDLLKNLQYQIVYAYTLGDFITHQKSKPYDLLIILNIDVDKVRLYLDKTEIAKNIPLFIASNELFDDMELKSKRQINMFKWPLDSTAFGDAINKVTIKISGMKTILLVEDEQINQDIVKSILEGKEYNLQIASDGMTALREIKTYKPDLILLDFMLPDLNGDEILYWVRGRYQKSELPVLVISSQDDRENVKELAKLGVNGYLVKPFDPQVFTERIYSIFGVK